MSWQEFRQWAFDTYGERVSVSTMRPVVWDQGVWRGYTYTGSGVPATYGIVQQLRFAMWLRTRHLIEHGRLSLWLKAAESYESGWLVNDGTGIRWEADPDPLKLVERGFVAIKCGL